jgi:hypothetical protein
MTMTLHDKFLAAILIFPVEFCKINEGKITGLIYPVLKTIGFWFFHFGFIITT